MSTDATAIQKWFDAHIDDEWGSEGVEITADDEEILAVVKVSTADEDLPDDPDPKTVFVKLRALRNDW